MALVPFPQAERGWACFVYGLGLFFTLINGGLLTMGLMSGLYQTPRTALPLVAVHLSTLLVLHFCYGQVRRFQRMVK